MNIVGLEIKEIGITKFLATKKEVELSITFNDGTNRHFSKWVTVSEPSQTSHVLVDEIKNLVVKNHKARIVSSVDETNVSVVFKQEDTIRKELPFFLETVNNHLHEISRKKDAEGYLDLIRELKNMKFAC